LVSEGLITKAELLKLNQSIEKEVENAFLFAEESAFPDSKDAFQHIYVKKSE